MPGLVGLAVNVTSIPAQTGFEEALIVMLTGRLGLTVIVIELEVAGFPEAQKRLEVRIHWIISPFTGEYA